MTNAEKFEEVFGVKIDEYPSDACDIFDHSICIDHGSCTMACPAYKFWSRKYKKPVKSCTDDSHYLPCICGHNRRRSTIDSNGNVTITCYKCKYTMNFSLKGKWSDSKVRKMWNDEIRRIKNG